MTKTEVDRLKAAYAALRKLTVQHPDDPRGWLRQGHVFCWYSGGGSNGRAGEEVNGSWLFLPWHRAFLYFHERILCKLLNDDTFALPYWDWDSQDRQTFPSIYGDPNNESNPLYDRLRSARPGSHIPAGVVSARIMNLLMNAPTNNLFMGSRNNSGAIENLPNGAVQIWTADTTMSDGRNDMGVLTTAAQDPVFFSHHGNIDRLWSVWLGLSPHHKNFPDQAWLSHGWEFYDENSVWTRIAVSDVIDPVKSLRCDYQPPSLRPIWSVGPSKEESDQILKPSIEQLATKDAQAELSWLKLWHEQRGAVTALACLAILALYLGYFAAMLLLKPAGLARLGAAGGIGEMPKPDGTLGWIVNLARLAMEKLALPWFVHRPRVRRAWSIEYRNGRVKLEDLGKPARESFLKEPEVLDVWVETRIVRVRQALADLELFDRRRIYVKVPVKSGSRETGRVIERPCPEDLRDTFARPRAVIPIIGTGGSGKSTLACEMARWAMADDPTIRLAAHRMVPVFVVQDTTDLLGAVTRNLREMLGEEELPDDLVRSLLSRKRVLVIVDALSEREAETQQHVEQVFKDSVGVVFNAVIITSRTEPQLGAVERTTLFPLRLDTKRIVPIIVGYLARLENVEALREGDAQLDLGKRILAIAEAGGDETPVTPLLVTLFVDSAVRRIAAGQSLDGMPHAVPEIFVDYLRRVNAGRPGEAGVTEDSFIAAAQCLAAVSLGSKFVPGDFMRADAVAALKAAGFSDSAAALLDRLVAGGVIERRPLGGVPALRFSLDPGAEYLAAIPQIFMLRQGAAPAFEGYFVKLRNIDGYPTLLEGYLAAFATCYRAYQPELRLPEISFPWELARRNRRRPKPVRASQIESLPHPPKD